MVTALKGRRRHSTKTSVMRMRCECKWLKNGRRVVAKTKKNWYKLLRMCNFCRTFVADLQMD